LSRLIALPIAGCSVPYIKLGAQRILSSLITQTPSYFHFGFRAESLLVCGHTSRTTELHAPVALSSEAEFFTAVIAAKSPR